MLLGLLNQVIFHRIVLDVAAIQYCCTLIVSE